jgi:predicted transcriptional regulator
MTTKEEVYWLLDHFPNLAMQQVADLIRVERPLVSRYAKLRSEQRSFAQRLRERTEASSSIEDTIWPGSDKTKPPVHYAEAVYEAEDV